MIRILKLFLFAALPCGLIVVASVIGITLRAEWESLPTVTDSDLFFANQSMVIEDRVGNELFRFFDDEDRTFIHLTDVPSYVPAAFIAIEDKRFFTRGCIDVRATTRAALANLWDYKSQGASTLTQQLVRTLYLTRDKTFERKIREILLACQMEGAFTREQILEQYINWISFGHGIAGVEQASRLFFDKEVKKLTIAEAAVLAAMPQRPSYFSPYGPHLYALLSEDARRKVQTGEMTQSSDLGTIDLLAGLLPNSYTYKGTTLELPGRANAVLTAMLEQQLITTQEREEAKRALNDLTFRDRIRPITAPHFVLSLKKEIDHLLTLSPELRSVSGLHVRTTLDADLQRTAEETVRDLLPTLRQESGAENMALIAIDTKTNEIRAYVGNADFFDAEHSGQVDMLREPRQTGSAFKPFLYAMMLEQGSTPETYIYDTPLETGTYRAGHSGYYGRMTIRTALARSRNVPAVRAFYAAGGEEKVLAFAESVGITTPSWRKLAEQSNGRPFLYNWTLALGAGEASLLEMAQGYSVFARDGMFRWLRGIESLQDFAGNTVYAPGTEEKRVLSAKSAQAITSILSDEDAREQGWQYIMHLPFGSAALKTGTGTLCKERNLAGSCVKLLPNNDWTIGYTDDLLVGIWVGNADNSPMRAEAASIMSATPIWKEFLIRAHALRSS